MSFPYSYDDIRIEDDSWHPDTNLHSLAKKCFTVELNKVYLKVGHDSPLRNHTDLPQSIVELVLLKVFGHTSGFCHSLGCSPDMHARAAFRWFHSSSSSNLYTTDLQQQRRRYKTRLISPTRNTRIAAWLQTCLDDLFLPVAGQFNPDHGFIIPTRTESGPEESLTDPSQTLSPPPPQNMEIIPASPSFGVDFPLDGSVPYLGSLESHPQVYSGNFPPLMSPSQEIHAGSETQHTIAVPDFPVWHATQDERADIDLSDLQSYSHKDTSYRTPNFTGGTPAPTSQASQDDAADHYQALNAARDFHREVGNLQRYIDSPTVDPDRIRLYRPLKAAPARNSQGNQWDGLTIQSAIDGAGHPSAGLPPEDSP